MLCKCGAELSGMWLEAPGIASTFCPIGHRVYFFRDPSTGEWETQGERIKRLSKVIECKACGDKYRVPFYNESNPAAPLCASCADKEQRAYDKAIQRKRQAANGHRKNFKSPWRIPWKGPSKGGRDL